MRSVYVLPNLVTSGALFSGLCAIIFASKGNYVGACYLILLAALLDAMDGPVARFTRSSSSFGLSFDSLSDLVAFGVAPAFLMFMKLDAIDSVVDNLHSWAPRMAIGVCGLYVICGAIRLARYNVQAGLEERFHFTGLPIPASAGALVSTFMVIELYLTETRALHRMILILMLLLAYLMVSTYPFPSLKTLHRRTARSFRAFVTLIVLIFVLVTFHTYFPLFAFVGFMSYIFVSLLHAIRRRKNLASYSPGTFFGLEDEAEERG